MNAIQFVENDPCAFGSNGDGFLNILYRLMHLRLSSWMCAVAQPTRRANYTLLFNYEINDRQPNGPSKIGQMGRFGGSVGVSHIEWWGHHRLMLLKSKVSP